MESNLPSWITDGRMMFGDDTTRQAATLQMVKNQPNSIAAQVAIAALVAAFWAPAQAAAPAPKISVPQVHVNLGAHAEPPKMSAPQLHVNAGAHVSTGNHFHKNVDGKGKAFAGSSGAGEGPAIRTFTHMQVEYKPQSDNGSIGKSGTGQSK